MSAILEIVIPGKPISGNHAKVPTENGRQVRSKESREYDKRIASIAKAAVIAAGWVMPDYVRVDMIIYGSRTDRDNACKEILDPCQGIVFAHDSRVLDGFIKRIKDGGEPRVMLRISEVNGAIYGFSCPRKPKPAKPVNPPYTFAECQAEARRRTAAKPRTLAEMKSGDVIKSFAERDRVLSALGIGSPVMLGDPRTDAVGLTAEQWFKRPRRSQR
jgi:Holliday junction resolvase RusA-like endonuclease